jgi:hypothetical protein
MLNRIYSLPPFSPLRAYLVRCFQSDVLWPLSPSDESLESKWHATLGKAGCELVRVIKVRGNRIVALVDHPEFGQCVMKGTCPVRAAFLGFANEAIARKVQSSNNGIFPEVKAITSSWVITGYIDGGSLDDRNSAIGLNPLAVRDYMHGLRDWSLSFHDGTRLCPTDVRRISKEYVGKCLSHYRYRSFSGRLQAALAMRSKRVDIESAVARLAMASESLDLPCALMCGDMGKGNIIEENGTGRLYNVDYEELRTGHWGFDAVYFVASLLEMNPSCEERADLFSLVLSDDYLGGPDAGDYFRSLADLLIRIGNTIFPPQYAVNRRSGSPHSPTHNEIEAKPCCL